MFLRYMKHILLILILLMMGDSEWFGLYLFMKILNFKRVVDVLLK